VAGKNYRYVGSHPETLDNGSPVAPGDYVKLTDEELKSPQNASLLEEGVLVEAPDAGKAKKESGDA
jgi:hypothetical protein